MSKEALLHYIIELRKRLLNCLILFAFVFLILFYFSNNLYTLLALPLLEHLPHGQGLIATHILSPFFVPLELTSIVALFLSMPFFLYQIWSFVVPALYQHERRLIWPLLFVSICLFYLGLIFAYFIMFPLLFKFLIHTTPKGVLLSPDIAQYLEFTLKLFLVFGLIFEIPVITILLIGLGITTREKLIQFRPYAIVSSFVLGMLLAPPDVLSQIFLAIPIWLLFEAGIVLAPFFLRNKECSKIV